ncbi:DNA excision repair protein ERCC-6-like 2 [Pelodytes ibericus]
MDCGSDAQDLWHTDERCLAPYLEDDELHEAVVRTIEHKEDGSSYAIVSFLDSTEKKILLSELKKFPGCSSLWNTSMFDDEDLEKPLFPDRRPPGPSVDYSLSNSGICIPYTINRYLRDYQRDGVQFLYGHYVRSTGCILGDDMGLGKTIQVISLLAAVLQKKGTREDIENNMPEFLLRTMKKNHSSLPPKKVFLIVSPLSVLFNWKDELQTWGYFKVTVIHGTKKDFELSRIKQGKYEIALTTYETLRLCLDELNSIEWAAIIVDEAHRIKNPKARITQVMKDLHCKVRIGLTGTILQNNMEELWCVMDWAVPGCLGNRNQFKEDFANPVEYGQRHNANKRELATGRKAMQRLASKMSPLFLRRTKTLISNQLPKKEDRIVYCSLSDFQKAVYQTVLTTQDVSLVLRGGEKCSCNSGRKRRKCCYKENTYGESVRTLYFSYLAILRKVANHAALLQTDTSTSKKQEAHIKRVCGEVFSKFPEFIQKSKDAAFETISDPKYSGKMKVLQQLLNHCRKNKDKVLLFSFSTKLLDVLESYCMASGLDYRRLDGSTKAEERLNIVKEFNSMQDVNICLVSTMAGGLGLNFVGANVVVVFDPTWNPANDLQAIDRAYRIGQCRDVKVFRLISLGTVEELIYLRQVYKQQLHCVVVGSENAKRYFEAVQGSKEHKGELFGMHNLFKLRTQGTCLTRDILEREGQVEAGVMSTNMYISQKELPSGEQMAVDTNNENNITDAKLDQRFQSEIFDFSSDSDEDVKGRSKLKFSKSPAMADCGKQLTLQQCGFSKIFEKIPEAGELNHEASGDNKKKVSKDSSIDMKDPLKLCKPSNSVCKGQTKRMNKLGWYISSDSEDDTYPIKKCKPLISKEPNVVLETESSSCDSDDDVILSSQMSAHEEMEKSALSRTLLSKCDKSNDSDSDDFIPGTSRKQTTNSSSDYISDESDDIKIPNKTMFNRISDSKKIKGQNSGAEKKSPTIDDFTSSDDDIIKRVQPNNEENRVENKTHRNQVKIKWGNQANTKLQLISKRKTDASMKTSIRNANIGNNIPHKKDHFGSLDKVLDGVEGVAYIHSNQSVVGSSTAENHMSRRAVRDVFELNQFSQLPANITAGTINKCEQIMEDELTSNSNNRLRHPVVHKQKKVHKTDEITFLIGETPRAIQRKQFDQMVAYFNMASTEEFAQCVVNAKSDERQNMLREFYSHHYSVAENLYPVQVPLSETVKTESINAFNVKRKRYTRLYSDQVTDNNKDVSGNIADSLDKKRRKCITQTFKADIIQNYGTSNSMDVAHSSSLIPEKKLSQKQCTVETVSSNKLTTTEILLKNSSSHTNTSASADELLKPESKTTCKQNLESSSITDLLGDTSILEDLFTSQANRQRDGPVRTHCEQSATKAKQRTKDFWDILIDQDDESFNKLTDVSVIEKVCERSAVSAASKKENWDDTLWMNNEKFIWRKNKPVKDLDYACPGKSSDP